MKAMMEEDTGKEEAKRKVKKLRAEVEKVQAEIGEVEKALTDNTKSADMFSWAIDDETGKWCWKRRVSELSTAQELQKDKAKSVIRVEEVKRCRYFKVIGRFIKGATWPGLRKKLFAMADINRGIKGHIKYENVVEEDSDLELLLFFDTRESAEAMYEAILNEYVEHYEPHQEYPHVRVLEASADEVKDPDELMTTGDYSRCKSIVPVLLPDTFVLNGDDDEDFAWSTEMKDCPEHVQRREGIFDPLKTLGIMLNAHINAGIKYGENDSVGNIIPLPSAPYCLWDNNLSGFGMPLFSIEPTTKVEELGPLEFENGDSFQTVTLKVYFFPSPWARTFMCCLRDGTTKISDGVFMVTISKRKAEEFIKQAMKRHQDTMALWNERRCV